MFNFLSKRKLIKINKKNVLDFFDFEVIRRSRFAQEPKVIFDLKAIIKQDLVLVNMLSVDFSVDTKGFRGTLRFNVADYSKALGAAKGSTLNKSSMVSSCEINISSSVKDFGNSFYKSPDPDTLDSKHFVLGTELSLLGAYGEVVLIKK